jgi:hypothetical protein
MFTGLRLWLAGSLATAFVALGIWGWIEHARADRVTAEFAAFRLGVKNAADAEALRQHTVNVTVAAAAKERAEDRALADAERDKEIAAYEAELAAADKNAACGFDDRDVKRLRSILR